MAYFKPYDIYATRLPVLKPGHILKIGDKYLQVVVVRRNRKKVALSGAQTDTRFKTETSSTYTPMVGNLAMNRVVHLQYVSVDQAQDTTFKWGTEPLLSKDYAEAVQSDRANLLAPLEIDRWSFAEEMHLYVTIAGSQNFYFEIVEYEIVEYAGVPKRPYLYITPNGQAIFVEAELTEAMARQAYLSAQQRQVKA